MQADTCGIRPNGARTSSGRRAIMTPTSVSYSKGRPPTRGQIIAYVCSVSLLAAGFGFAAVLVSFLVNTDARVEPAHLDFAPSVIFGSAGAVAAIALVAPVSYMVGKWEPLRSLPACLGWGLALGLVLPIVTGALLPSSVVVMDWNRGLVSAGSIPSELLSAQFRAPMNSFVYTSLNVLTGLLFGVVFGLGFWVINTLVAASNLAVSRYGPWIFAFALGTAAVLWSAYGPSDVLARLG